MYLISYKIFINNDERNLFRSSVIPEILKKHSFLQSDFIILIFINFGICLFIGKLLAIFYLPYGIGKAMSSCIDSMINSDEIKQEYTDLNNNFTKNNDTIRNITSQKLMTGKTLSKQEKELIKNCKENQAILEHKQEILEDKNSKCQVILNYITLPLKFLYVIILFLFSFSFILSNITVLVTTLSHSICGFECGYLTQRIDKAFSLQSILYYFSPTSFKYGLFIQNGIILVFILFVLHSIFISLKNKGICIGFYSLYDVNDIRNSRTLTMVSILIFFLVANSVTNDVIFLFQDYAKFSNLAKTCHLGNFESDLCGISLYGIFMLQINLNFPFFSYVSIIMQTITTFLAILFTILLPVISAFNYFSKKKTKKNKYQALNTNDPEENAQV